MEGINGNILGFNKIWINIIDWNIMYLLKWLRIDRNGKKIS